ncbi:MAG: PIN domain-containing protein [Candidatus Eiseniibacteriota bacterium]
MAGSKGHRKHARVREARPPRYAPTPDPGVLNGVLLDTDVVVQCLRGDPGIKGLAADLEASGTPTFCTAVTWAEIFSGLRPGEEAITEAFLEARGEVILDAEAGRQAGRYLSRYARSHGLEVPDALIAAAAATAGLRLWTLNRRDYPMKDLRFLEATARP